MIELKKLSGGYGQFEAVHDVSLSLLNGQITAVIGPNGCGKSTLLKLCCGQLHPSRGEVLADGRPLSALSRTDIARKIALLPQSRTVPDITVGSLVLHGRFPWLDYPRVYRTEDKAAAEESMKRMGIWEKRHKLLARLSGGERQKTYLAMVLAQNTGHVFLDEPTTYLDIAHQLELLVFLSELKQEGKCVVTVLHDLGMALEAADRIAVMKDGRLMITGTPEQVIASGAIEDAFGVKLRRREQIGFECLEPQRTEGFRVPTADP